MRGEPGRADAKQQETLTWLAYRKNVTASATKNSRSLNASNTGEYLLPDSHNFALSRQ
jgi:hypothetical protein